MRSIQLLSVLLVVLVVALFSLVHAATPTTTPSTATNSDATTTSDAELDKMYSDVMVDYNADMLREKEAKINPYETELKRKSSILHQVDDDKVLEEAYAWSKRNPTPKAKPVPTPVVNTPPKSETDAVFDDAQQYLDKVKKAAEPKLAPSPAPTAAPAPLKKEDKKEKLQAIAKVLQQKADFQRTLKEADSAAASNNLPTKALDKNVVKALFPKVEQAAPSNVNLNFNLTVAMANQKFQKNLLKQQADLATAINNLKSAIVEYKAANIADLRKRVAAKQRARKLHRKALRIRNLLLEQKDQMARLRKVIKLQRKLAAAKRQANRYASMSGISRRSALVS